MPIVNTADSVSTIKMPTPSNITDAEVSKAKRDRALTGAPFAAALKHLKNMSAKYSGAHQVNTNRIAAARERKGDAMFRLANLKRDHERYGTKPTSQELAEFEEIVREADEEIAECSKRKHPILDMDEILQKASRVRTWLPHTKTYYDGDLRHPDLIRKEAKKIRLVKEDERDKVQQANCHSEDAIEKMMVDLRQHEEKGKPVTAGHLQGFTIDFRGNFQPKRASKTEFPETLSKANQFSEDLAMVDDALNFVIWANFDSIAAALAKQILEESNDDEAIRDADRPALLAKAEAELLESQRVEEAANKLCERAGIAVFRDSDWPIEVLLEVEAPPKTTRAPVVKAAPVEDADAPDFETAGDDE